MSWLRKCSNCWLTMHAVETTESYFRELQGHESIFQGLSVRALGGHSLSTESVHCISRRIGRGAALRRRLEHGENFYDTQMKAT